jgi:hypothetical protein
MDEVFVEQIIKVRTGIKGWIFRVLSVIAVLIGIMSMLILGILGFTITVLLAYGAYMIWSYTSLEYEYSFLNGELSVDKIMGQRKRKHMDSFDIKDAEIVAPAFSEQVVRASHNAVVKDYSSKTGANTVYAMVVNNSNGKYKVVFEPGEKVINAMYHIRANVVKIEE